MRQSLVATPALPLPNSPPVILFDLPPPFQIPELRLQEIPGAHPRPDLLPGQAPPAALVVAQTMVRMI